MKKRISEAFWIWARFDSGSTLELKKIYEQVNKYCYGPFFQTHLTLSGPIFGSKKNNLEKFKSLKYYCKKIEIESYGYEFSNKFYESIFIKINNSKNLLNMKNTIDLKFSLKKKKYNPHVSLYYGELNTKEKVKIIKNLPDSPKKIKLVKLCFVYVNEEKNIWKILEEIILN